MNAYSSNHIIISLVFFTLILLNVFFIDFDVVVRGRVNRGSVTITA